jgi:hypothetical protein
MANLEGTGVSLKTKNDAGLKAKFALSMVRYYAANQNLRLPMLSPHYGDLHGFPPLLIHVGEDEILLSNATKNSLGLEATHWFLLTVIFFVWSLSFWFSAYFGAKEGFTR